MYKLVALVFLVVNGHQSPDPVTSMANKTTFATEELCMNYFDTTEGALSKKALEMLVKSQDEALTVTYKCVKKDDGAI
jgi:hypothetical protein